MTRTKKVVSAISLFATLLFLPSVPGRADDNRTATSDNFLTFNERIQPDEQSPSPSPFLVPPGKVLVITDVVIQNRAPGDVPVDASQFSRVRLAEFSSVTAPTSGHDIIFTVVGNDTLNVHFNTGLRATTDFSVFNIGNSTAPFIEFTVTGFLERANSLH